MYSLRIAQSLRIGAGCALVCIPFVPGCEKAPDTTASAAAGRPEGTASPVAPAETPPITSTSSGFATLAANLADPFLKSREKKTLSKELAQLLAEANIKIVRYQSISTNDPMLRRIAAEAADAGAKMLESHQALNEMEQDDGLTDILIGGLGLYLGDPTTILHGAGSILQKGDAKQQERIRWGSAFNRSRAAQLMLPEAAKTYAGAASAAGPVVAIDFDESFAGSADHDFLALRNVSGSVLSNCTVLVELIGKDGAVCQNVHFDPYWEREGERYARYGIGVESDSGIYGRRTVHGVQEVRVSVWSDELRQETITYRYPGAEKAKDVRALLDGKLKVKYRYHEFQFFGDGPRVDVELAGVPMIPAHKLVLTFMPKSGEKTTEPTVLSWDLGEWYVGATRRLALGNNMKFKPATMRIGITFPGIDYEYTRDVAIE